jgi:hypothetical protein
MKEKITKKYSTSWIILHSMISCKIVIRLSPRLSINEYRSN